MGVGSGDDEWEGGDVLNGIDGEVIELSESVDNGESIGETEDGRDGEAIEVVGGLLQNGMERTVGSTGCVEENHHDDSNLEEDLTNVTDREGVSCSVGGGGGTHPTFNHPQNIHYLRHGLVDWESSSDNDEGIEGFVTGFWQEDAAVISDSDGIVQLELESN